MTDQDLLQDQLKELEEKRHNLIFEIGFLETRKSGMLADYWEIGRRMAWIREQLDKYGKPLEKEVGSVKDDFPTNKEVLVEWLKQPHSEVADDKTM